MHRAVAIILIWASGGSQLAALQCPMRALQPSHIQFSADPAPDHAHASAHDHAGAQRPDAGAAPTQEQHDPVCRVVMTCGSAVLGSPLLGFDQLLLTCTSAGMSGTCDYSTFTVTAEPPPPRPVV